MNEAIVKAGYEAYKAGKDITANPYRWDTAEAEAWDTGYAIAFKCAG